LAFISGIHPFICKIQCFSRKLSIENAGVINKDKYDPITLKQEQIAFIVDAYNKKSMLCKDLAQKFSISRTTIHRIVRSKNNNPNSKLKTKRKFTKDNIIQVINLWNEGNSARKIAKITGMDRSGISRIVNRKQCLETTQNLYIRK
jgi:transposase